MKEEGLWISVLKEKYDVSISSSVNLLTGGSVGRFFSVWWIYVCSIETYRGMEEDWVIKLVGKKKLGMEIWFTFGMMFRSEVCL